MFNYNDFMSRNWMFIDSSVQKKIKKTKLLFTGCGLGSFIAELALRSGFEDVTLADDDKVELSNLNRQNYDISNINVSKVEALSSRLKSINPKAKIKIINKRISDASELGKAIEKSDIIINTFDINDVYFDLIKIASENKIITILPFNVGFGSFVLALDSVNCGDFIKNYGNSKSDLELLLNLFHISKKDKIKLPDYININLNQIIKQIDKIKINPQVGIASFITSSIVCSMMINYLESGKINSFPNFNYIDFKDKI